MMKYIIANWKSNMQLKNLASYFQTINSLEVNTNLIFAVPNVFLIQAKELSKFVIASQDCEYFPYGSYTGRISYQHLLDLGINYSIVGHSEQRRFNDNTSSIINEKLKTCLANNIKVILCIGEDKTIYNQQLTAKFLIDELNTNLKDIDCKKHQDNLIIAYEPIWSIGTGVIPDNAYIQNVIELIKKHYPVAVLYGGSVNKNNIVNLSKINHLDGFLIGSASIDANEFIETIKKLNIG